MSSTYSGIEGTTGVQFASGQSYYDHLLTNFFLPVLADARNNSSVLWSQIQKVNKHHIEGRFVVFPIRTTRNIGRGSVRPGSVIPDPGSQGAKTQTTETRTYQARVKIDGETLRRGKTNGGAFITPEQLEIDGQADDIQIDMNRMSHNDGSGRMAEVASVSGTTITLRINQSIEGAPACTTSPGLYLEVGDRIGFYTPGANTLVSSSSQIGFYVFSLPTASTVRVSLIPPSASGSAAVDISGSLTVGDWLVRVASDTPSNGSTSPVNSAARAEMMGIGGIFSDAGCLDGNGASGSQQSGANDYTVTSVASANFQGNAATSANPWNQAVVNDNGGSGARTLSEQLLQQALSDSEERNNATIDMLLSSYGTYNSYVKLLVPDKRYNDTLELKGGHKMLSFNGIGWWKDRFCYNGRVYGINLGELQYFETEPLQPLDPFGIGRWERLRDLDAYWTGVVTSGNLGVSVRQRVGFVLTELAA